MADDRLRDLDPDEGSGKPGNPAPLARPTAGGARRLTAKDEAYLRELVGRLFAADKGLREAEANWKAAKEAFIAANGKPDPRDPVVTHDWLTHKSARPDLAYWWGCVADYHHEIAALAGQISAFVAALEALGYRVPRQVPRAL